jgi:FMN reductase
VPASSVITIAGGGVLVGFGLWRLLSSRRFRGSGVRLSNAQLGSRTRAPADTVTVALLARLGERGVALAGPTTLELAEIVGISFSGDVPAVGGGGGVADPLAVMRSARLLVVATPTYKGFYTGLS